MVIVAFQTHLSCVGRGPPLTPLGKVFLSTLASGWVLTPISRDSRTGSPRPSSHFISSLAWKWDFLVGLMFLRVLAAQKRAGVTLNGAGTSVRRGSGG